ncbi:MAG TPA: beta-N-acetylglucosaminidase domain-containing protein [Kofleriaceae bacterium]|nr:beta-N-acetylglucosaminidase domain-containing protein [Kofleriaceae bacterium]
MRSLLLGVTFAVLACNGGHRGEGDPLEPDEGDDDGGKGDSPFDPAECVAGPEVTPHEPAPFELYPQPRAVEIGEEAADVTTACVDTHALADHDRLDALVPARLAAHGLTTASLDCGCDYILYFAAAEPDELGDAGDNPERHAAQVSIENGRAVARLFGASERAALYALDAALALLEPREEGGGMIHTATIADWPGFRQRGIIEGVYGPDCDTPDIYRTPWLVDERADAIMLMSTLRENTFIYGPKCDPYSRALWDEPYPEDEATLVRVALHEAERSMIDFVWAVSPGGPVADFDLLAGKIDAMRDLGVSHFAIFLDDIDDHSAPDQLETILALDSYIKASAPEEHLILVGTTYCSDPEAPWVCGGPNEYTDRFGAELPADTQVLWTGLDVIPDTMEAADMVDINQSLRRRVTIWDNFPRDELAFRGRSADLVDAVAGYFSNPVLNEYPVPGLPTRTFFQVLGPIADYLWHPDRYDADPSFDTWQPILDGLVNEGACGACAVEVPGWTCTEPHAIGFCDPNTGCWSEHPCPGGCTVGAPGVADLCR